ncbi:hypothetical protein KR044_010811 [Drosophila immigrans]|nr:hypothetical protein KR044_010811 [Drosophila immigrans]
MYADESRTEDDAMARQETGQESREQSVHGEDSAAQLGRVAQAATPGCFDNLNSQYPVNFWDRYNVQSQANAYADEALPNLDATPLPPTVSFGNTTTQFPAPSQLPPEAAYAWPSTEQAAPAQSVGKAQYRTYGSPMLQQRQQPRPTILVIVVNKPASPPGASPPGASPPGASPPGASSPGNYPMAGYPGNFQALHDYGVDPRNACSLASSRYPLGDYQKGGAVSHAPASRPRSM